MLNPQTRLYEDQFTEAEYATVRKHHRSADSPAVDWTTMFEAWRDARGTLCVRYANGEWWHYNERGEWW